MASSNEQQHDEQPSQSSAALCISLELLGTKFGPEFTHQCFEGEWIRGYQPPKHVLDTTAVVHSSHQHHEEASHTLQVQVKLSPSCQTCTVETDIHKKPREIVTRVSKRPRLLHVLEDNAQQAAARDDKDDEEETSPPEDNNNDDSDFCDSDNDTSSSACSEQQPEGNTRTRRMPVEEIVQRCSKALPRIVQDHHNDYLKQPVGTIVQELERNDKSFVITLAADASEYHKQVQKLALWFIESADCVDLDCNEGNWKVLYLFEYTSKRGYSLVGYLTLFHFLAPFKKPKSGIVARVCQALILPPYQRMGLGKILFKQVYQYAHDSEGDDEIVEINVEDPAPAFSQLRNRVDYELLQESISSSSSSWLDSKYTTTTPSDTTFYTPLNDKDAIQAAAVARITPRQVQIAHELYKLSLLEREDTKQYRVMVKKRLLKVHREELGACSTKQEKQDLLSKLYDETLAQYKAILKRK